MSAEAAGAPTQATAEQREAIVTREGSVFLEAGAGTGKTRVLVERYCAAVCEDEVPCERILAFTFTDRAADELRARIRAELTRRSRAAIEAGDADRGAELARFARDTERAWITTIHGFCRRLLAAHPVAAGLDPRFRVIDEPEADRLGERAFLDALERLVSDGDEAVGGLAAATRRESLAAMVRSAHDRLRSQGIDPPRLPDPGEPVRSRRSEGEAPLNSTEEALARRSHAAIAGLLDSYAARYRELKDARSGADFADLELRALGLLRGSKSIGEAWRERFDHLMVDEFQDTNRVQLGLIDSLVGPGARLFTVGDEFQSIYRFRHADLGVFRLRRDRAGADSATAVLPLLGNFRSHPDVLAGINLVGTTLLDDFSTLHAAEREAAGKPAAPAPAGIELLLIDRSEEDDRPGGEDAGPRVRDSDQLVEARFLARRLRELADSGVPRGEMVVLLRAFTHVDAYAEALEDVGLSPYVVGGRGYWSQQQVEDLLRLLGAIANPLDDEYLLGALASPACGAGPDALWLLRSAAGDGRHLWPTLRDAFGGEEDAAEPSDEAAEALRAIDAADAERLRTFCERLAGLRAAAPLLPLDSLIDRAMTAFGYDLALLARRGGPWRMANVRKLMRLAREFEEGEGRDLRGFLDFAESRTARDVREGLAALQAEGHDGVRVMTVHAAKGLEFPVVAVADLGRGLAAGGRSVGVAIGRVEAEDRDPRLGMRVGRSGAEALRLWDLVKLEREEREADAQEACRLAYVAASRAQRRLILSGCFKPTDLEPTDPRPSDSVLGRLLPALVERGWSPRADEVALERAISPGGAPTDGAEPILTARIHRPAPTTDAAGSNAAGAVEISSEEGSPERASPPLPQRRPATPAAGPLSYTALSSYARCGYRFYVERLLGLSAEPLDARSDSAGARAAARERRMALGDAVHACLEWSARNAWAEPPAEVLGAVTARAGLDAGDEGADAVAAMTSAWHRSPLLAELADSGAALRPEVPFVLSLGGAVLRGQIDLLAQLDDQLVVVDYKTDAVHREDPDELGKRYAVQRDVYALAVSKSAGSAPPSIRTAHVFLAGETIAETRYDADELDAARERVERLVSGIATGRFERTESPNRPLCLGCPAAAHLCGAPAWRPSRGAAVAAPGGSA